MVPHIPALGRRRLASLALVAVIGAAIAAPGAATAAATTLDDAAAISAARDGDGRRRSTPIGPRSASSPSGSTRA